jgi:hypothetical protein
MQGINDVLAQTFKVVEKMACTMIIVEVEAMANAQLDM